MNSFRKAIVLACASAFCASGAIAATQTLNGTAFDISYDDAVVGLFGTPTLLGNSLFFAPGGSPGFSAQTDGGLDVTNSTFSFTISANQGYTLNTFALLEEGDYFYFGSVAGVAASGQLRVKPLEPLASTLTAALSPSSFVANSAFDFTTQNWSAGATIDSGSVTVA